MASKEEALAQHLALTKELWTTLQAQNLPEGFVTPAEAFFFARDAAAIEKLAQHLADGGWACFVGEDEEHPDEHFAKAITEPYLVTLDSLLELTDYLVRAAHVFGCELEGYQLATGVIEPA